MTGWGKNPGRKKPLKNLQRQVFGAQLAFALSIMIGATISSPPAAVSQQALPQTQALDPQTATTPAKSGSISGTVIDQSGAVVANVEVTLTQQGSALAKEALSDADGHFVFSGLAPGSFQLIFTASRFATRQASAVLQAGEDYVAPPVALAVARANVDVEVTESTAQVAEDQVKVEEKQRVLGVIPNFYVSYVPNAAPLTTKLKFHLAWKSVIDPVSYAISGGIAGIEQADNAFSGYGQGAQGYGKRYGATYADLMIGSFLGGAILPSLLKQDPRYFYKGTGSRKSRFLYAIAGSVICKGDNGHWQPDYSGILGGLAAGGISNLYYPSQNRNGAALTFENALIGIAGGAAGNILQEFVVRRFTPHLPAPDVDKP